MNINKILGLKVDPENPFHYIIGVSCNSNPMSKDRGKLSLKYGPIRFTNEDVQNLKFALSTHTMELPKTSLKDALNAFEVRELVSSLSMMLISCKINSCSVHHFSSNNELHDSFFEDIVKNASSNKYMIKYLERSKIA